MKIRFIELKKEHGTSDYLLYSIEPEIDFVASKFIVQRSGDKIIGIDLSHLPSSKGSRRLEECDVPLKTLIEEGLQRVKMFVK